jgi:hypothetical protein
LVSIAVSDMRTSSLTPTLSSSSWSSAG